MARTGLGTRNAAFRFYSEYSIFISGPDYHKVLPECSICGECSPEWKVWRDFRMSRVPNHVLSEARGLSTPSAEDREKESTERVCCQQGISNAIVHHCLHAVTLLPRMSRTFASGLIVRHVNHLSVSVYRQFTKSYPQALYP